MREQWLQERIEYFSEMEGAIYHEALGADECDRAQVTMALMKVDVNLDEKQVLALHRQTEKTNVSRFRAVIGTCEGQPHLRLRLLGLASMPRARQRS